MWFKLKLWWNNPAENLWFTPALGALLAIFSLYLQPQVVILFHHTRFQISVLKH